MLQLNVIALTELTHAFAADMVRRGAGRILLVGSLGGFQPLPMYAAYAASKAYVLSFGEALHEENSRIAGWWLPYSARGSRRPTFLPCLARKACHCPMR